MGSAALALSFLRLVRLLESVLFVTFPAVDVTTSPWTQENELGVKCIPALQHDLRVREAIVQADSHVDEMNHRIRRVVWHYSMDLHAPCRGGGKEQIRRLFYCERAGANRAFSVHDGLPCGGIPITTINSLKAKGDCGDLRFGSDIVLRAPRNPMTRQGIPDIPDIVGVSWTGSCHRSSPIGPNTAADRRNCGYKYKRQSLHVREARYSTSIVAYVNER